MVLARKCKEVLLQICGGCVKVADENDGGQLVSARIVATWLVLVGQF